MIGIYKITSPSKKVYIGQSVDIEKRFLQYKKLNCKSQSIIYRSLLKYGYEKHKFEILCECDINELNEKERYYQDAYCVLGKGGLNCILTKSSDRSGIFSEETKLKMSNSRIGKKLSEETISKFKLRKMSDDNKEKLIEINKGHKYNVGRKASEETRKKMSDSNKGKNLGKKHSNETKLKIILAIKGKRINYKHSEETKAKLSNSQIGKKASEETKAKLSASSYIKKTVYNTEKKIFYESIVQASKDIGVKSTYLGKMLSGIRTNKSKCVLIK